MWVRLGRVMVWFISLLVYWFISLGEVEMVEMGLGVYSFRGCLIGCFIGLLVYGFISLGEV